MFYAEGGEALERLPREVIDAPSLGTFKDRLVGALSNLIQLKMSVLTAGGLDFKVFKGPFQPKPFYDSVEAVQPCWAPLPVFSCPLGGKRLFLQTSLFQLMTAAPHLLAVYLSKEVWAA